MRTFRFYKDIDYRWYVDLPEWDGDKSDLEMVLGADAMLEYMAEGSNDIRVILSPIDFNGSDKLSFVRLADEYENGAFYFMEPFKGININLEMWLCDVTKFVFGDFPLAIYVSPTE